jgi:hypothetical protein
LLAGVLAVALDAALPLHASPHLTGAERLARAYDAILDGRVEQAREELTASCAPAPAEACQLLKVAALWWQIQQDPENRSLDGAFSSGIEAAIRATGTWTQREPKRAEAWFYLGAAYAVRIQWQALRGERLAAARDGKRVKDALERSLALDPGLNDAYFGIGLYHYYADLAPTVLKFLRWLLLLPGGNRAEGLAEMLKTRESGELLRGEADYQLHLVYLWYENQPAKALALLEGLRQRYLHNPVFLARIAEVQRDDLHDQVAALSSFRTLETEARQRRLSFSDIAEVRARLGMAEELDALGETDRAIELLREIADARPAAPYGALARAEFRLGQAYGRMGEGNAAAAAYAAAIAAAPPDDPFHIRTDAADAARRRADPRAGEAYRLSLQGWRLLEKGALDEAAAALARSLEIRPDDPVTHYRRGRLLQARRADSEALAEFAVTLRSRLQAPAPIVASAYLESGRLLEARGDRAGAIEMYRAATRVPGAEPRTHEAATRSLARLQSSTEHASSLLPSFPRSLLPFFATVSCGLSCCAPPKGEVFLTFVSLCA